MVYIVVNRNDGITTTTTATLSQSKDRSLIGLLSATYDLRSSVTILKTAKTVCYIIT